MAGVDALRIWLQRWLPLALAVMEALSTKFPFEFCALRFLIQWKSKEQCLHRDIRAEPTVNQFRSALRYFKVARNFKGLGEEDIAVLALRAFMEVREQDNITPEEKVIMLARRFKADGFQANLSAASKLLWLKYRGPLVIYDSRAVAALTAHFGRDIGNKNYHKYCEVWRGEYKRHVEKIDKAVRQLQHVRDFMPTWRMSNETLLRMANRPWFKERVFDIYLWEIGGDG